MSIASEDTKPAAKLPEPPWLVLARAELGIRETPGPKHTPRILSYFEATHTQPYDGDETPWCAAFVSWCLERAGYSSAHTAGALRYLHWGRELEHPRVGCVAVLRRGESAGHVGFMVGQDELGVHLLGGNQGNRVSIKPYPAGRALAYRWPREVP